MRFSAGYTFLVLSTIVLLAWTVMPAMARADGCTSGTNGGCGMGDISSPTITLTCPNSPIPGAYLAQTNAKVGQALTFAATGTSDEGSIRLQATLPGGPGVPVPNPTYRWLPSSTGFVASGSTLSYSYTFSQAGVYSMSASVFEQDYTGNEVSMFGGNSNADSCSVVVSGPDLTAGASTPTSITVGTAATFSSTISNIAVVTPGFEGGPPEIEQRSTANAAAAASTVLFQRATSAAGAGATSIGTIAVGSIAAGATRTASLSYTFPVADAGTTRYVRACADTTDVVEEGNLEGNNCGAWTATVVSAVPAPDLSAGAVTPTTATGGTAVTLSSTVSNTGTLTSGAGFTNLFQRATSAAGANATDIGTFARTTALAASGTFAATLSYTFPSSPSATTWYVRVCADKSSAASTGTIAESDEVDNCGAWTAIAVAASPQCSDGVDNDSDGRTDTADYGCTGGTDTTETPNPQCSDNANNDSSEDSLVDYPNDLGCASYTDTSESPNPPPVGPTGTPSAYITASPDRVAVDTSATLSWSAQNVSSCSISGTNGFSQNVTPDPSFQIATSSGSSGTVTTQTTFTLTCTPTASSRVIVNVDLGTTEF